VFYDGAEGKESNGYGRSKMIESIIGAIAATLTKSSFKVLFDQFSRRGARSDIVAIGPDGQTFVIEVKMGEGRAHFSLIAQVESLASGLEGKASPATPVLVTNLEVPEKLRGAANAVGVDIVEASGSDSDVAEALLRHLVPQSAS
jgi:hypothetical protein